MTLQRIDFMFVDGEPNPIAAAAPCPFVPREFSLRYGGWHATSCYRGFYVDFELRDRELRIRELHLVVHADDRARLAAGQLFGCRPAEVVGSQFVFRDVPNSYSGKILVSPQSYKPSRQTQLLLTFDSGRLTTRHELPLHEMPEGLTPSSGWVEYGELMWLPAE